jgi:peptidyl-prolyl cis-trans isomerase C
MTVLTRFRPMFAPMFVLGSALLVAGPALAEDAAPAAAPAAPAAAPAPAPDKNAVVARINGEAITQQDIALALQDFRDTLQQLAPADRLPALVNGYIDIRLMARAAEADGLDKQSDTAHYLAYTRDRALRTVYLTEKVFGTVDEAAIKKRYDEETAKFVPEDEVHAEHILVDKEEDAKAIIAELDKGGDFAAIAKEKSTDTGSGQAGGDLGFFTKDKMVPEFANAAFALNVGEYTKTPVKSQFGYHVIKVLEKRKSAPPSFDDQKDDLARQLGRETILAIIDALHASAKIEMVPAPGAAATPPADATTPAVTTTTLPGATATPPATAPAQYPWPGRRRRNRRWRRRPFRRFRQSPASASRSPKPASATRTGATCSLPYSTRARPSPVSSRARSARRRRSTGARQR